MNELELLGENLLRGGGDSSSFYCGEPNLIQVPFFPYSFLFVFSFFFSQFFKPPSNAYAMPGAYAKSSGGGGVVLKTNKFIVFTILFQ